MDSNSSDWTRPTQVNHVTVVKPQLQQLSKIEKDETATFITPSVMASIVEKEVPIHTIQLEALVVMKVIKHSTSKAPTTATGSLVGMDVNGTLECTNCFPFPIVDLPAEAQYEGQHFNAAAAAPRAKSNATYQADMIKMLKEVNMDANNVGWYTSANLGNFINLNFIENQYYYQKEMNERTVALVHDPSRTSQGALALRAFRLTTQFMTAYKDGKFTVEALQKSGLKYTDILVEIPITLHNSHNVTQFLHQIPQQIVSTNGVLPLPTSLQAIISNTQLTDDPFSGVPDLSSLNLSIDPFLSSTADNLLDAIETHHVESNNFSYHQRAMAREQAKITQWQAKRKAENAARTLAKQPLLPEDEWQRLFKLPQEPSRLESMLNARQVEQYARQVDGWTAGTTGKMFGIRGNLLPGEGDDNTEE